MAELTGCWQPAADLSAQHARMCAALAATGVVPAAHTCVEHGCVSGFALKRLPQRVSMAQSAGVTVVVVGRIFDLPPRINAAQHLLGQYRAESVDFAARLSGEYAAAILDARSVQLAVLTDKIGRVPLYYSTVGGALLFSSQVKALLTHPGLAARPQLSALAEQFMGARWLAPTETMFADVHALPPAHALIATAGRIRLEKYWEFRPEPLGTSDHREQFHSLFQNAVHRRMGDKTAVLVSGGLDSSSVFCVARTLDVEPAPIGVSYTAADDSVADERVYLAAIERDSGPILRVPFEPVDTPWQPFESVWRSEFPTVVTAPGPFERALQTVSDLGVTTVLDGGYGDQVLAPWPPPYLFTLAAQLRWSTLWRHLRAIVTLVPPAYRHPVKRDLLRMFMRELTPQFLLDLRRPMVNRRSLPGVFTDELRQNLSAHERWSEWLPRGLSPHASSVYQTVRLPFYITQYESANKSAIGYDLERSAPFLDIELIEFLMRLPGAVQFRDGVFKAILRDSLRGTVPDRILDRRDKADFEASATGAIDSHWDEMEEVIRSCDAGIQHGVFDAERLRQRLDFLRKSRHIHSTVATGELHDLFGLAVWLTVFFGSHNGERNGFAPRIRSATSTQPV